MKIPLSQEQVLRLPTYPQYKLVENKQEIIYASTVWVHLDLSYKVEIYKVPVANWWKPPYEPSSEEHFTFLQQTLNRHLEQCLIVSKYMKRDVDTLSPHVLFDTLSKADNDFELKLFTLYP